MNDALKTAIALIDERIRACRRHDVVALEIDGERLVERIGPGWRVYLRELHDGGDRLPEIVIVHDPEDRTHLPEQTLADWWSGRRGGRWRRYDPSRVEADFSYDGRAILGERVTGSFGDVRRCNTCTIERRKMLEDGEDWTTTREVVRGREAV